MKGALSNSNDCAAWIASTLQFAADGLGNFTSQGIPLDDKKCFLFLMLINGNPLIDIEYQVYVTENPHVAGNPVPAASAKILGGANLVTADWNVDVEAGISPGIGYLVVEASLEPTLATCCQTDSMFFFGVETDSREFARSITPLTPSAPLPPFIYSSSWLQGPGFYNGFQFVSKAGAICEIYGSTQAFDELTTIQPSEVLLNRIVNLDPLGSPSSIMLLGVPYSRDVYPYIRMRINDSCPFSQYVSLSNIFSFED